MKKEQIYLDHAAATPLDKQVFQVMEPFFSRYFYNPSASTQSSRRVHQAIEVARSNVANILGSRPAELIFTSGATESNNLVVKGIREAFPKGEILISAIEHESVQVPAEKAGAKKIPVNGKGVIDLSALASMISKKTVLASVMLVNNEIGSVQPLREIATLVELERKRRLKSGDKTPIYLHTDATQAANFFDLHVSRLSVDMMSLNGGKIYGPKQTGLLYVRTGVNLAPQILGGGQEFGQRSGTQNAAGIVGFAKAFELAQQMRAEQVKKLKQLQAEFEEGLERISPHIFINGGKQRAPHIVSASFPGQDNERLMIELDERGIIVAVGSACSASSEEPSHVLQAIGLSDDDARSTLRFSMGRQTTKKQIQKTLRILEDVIKPSR
ncbi:cysteine desulfurase [Candidatus Saccharibacteria bacterium]|jgi:cysteine desulfurase|nr:cysteine desulfurase [Candidatus Saccharibacteria bacterium]